MSKYAVAYMVSLIPKVDRIQLVDGCATYYCGTDIVAVLPRGSYLDPEMHLTIDIVETESESEAMAAVKSGCPNAITQLTAKKVE